jgi:hypothetical protein
MKILIDDEFTDKATERLGASIVDTPSDHCARCDRTETAGDTLLPFGVNRHAWLHSGCRDPWADVPRAEAVATLAGMGITVPQPR